MIVKVELTRFADRLELRKEREKSMVTDMKPLGLAMGRQSCCLPR